MFFIVIVELHQCMLDTLHVTFHINDSNIKVNISNI